MRIKILSIAVVLLSMSAIAQKGVRVGYIDMNYILENVPEYNEANTELQSRVQKWKEEIDLQLSEVEEMRTALANERVLLTKELVEEREEDILYKEKEVIEYQQQRFGPTGSLVIQKQRLVQPIQDQVFNSVQEIAKTKKFDFIFDKSADFVMLYSADRYDISDLVLRNITRAAKRTQVQNKKQRKKVEGDEANTFAQDKELQERERALKAKTDERARLIDEKKAERERIRAEKIKEYEERRNKLLAERTKKRDSLIQLRENKLKALKAKK